MAYKYRQRLAFALLAVAMAVTQGGPAGAQFAGGRAAFDQRMRPEPVQFRDFFGGPFWGGGRGGRGGGYGYRPSNSYDPYNPFYPRPQQPVESVKPPAPRKAETPPTEPVIVIGDFLPNGLPTVEETFADAPEVGIVRKIRPYSGLVRYDVRADAPDGHKRPCGDNRRIIMLSTRH